MAGPARLLMLLLACATCSAFVVAPTRPGEQHPVARWLTAHPNCTHTLTRAGRAPSLEPDVRVVAVSVRTATPLREECRTAPPKAFIG